MSRRKAANDKRATPAVHRWPAWTQGREGQEPLVASLTMLRATVL